MGLAVVQGKTRTELTRAQLLELRAPYASLVVDVGTGDGRFAYRLAKERPDALVVGLDASAGRLEEVSWRALRKPARGGVPNVLYALGRVEEPPPELEGLADELHVVLPWAGLLRGLVLAEEETLRGLVFLAAPGASLEVILNAQPFAHEGLPELGSGYVDELRPRYAAAGIELAGARLLGADEVRRLPTSWARRLTHRRVPETWLLEARVVGGGAPG